MPLKNNFDLNPIVVDLDGTLIHTDTLHELALQLFREKPYLIFFLPFWLLNGKAYLKKRIAECIEINTSLLPFNDDLIEWLKSEKSKGRSLILCTAADLSVAKKISNYLGLFDDVLASNGLLNLAGANKACLLVEKYGENGFEYVGNSSVDLDVWKKSKKGIVVSGPISLVVRARQMTEVRHIIPQKIDYFNVWAKVFRVHQWIKNILIFVPLFASHEVVTRIVGTNLSLAFLSFSLCASSVYISNDLLDLESDRRHPRKRNRPFASGRVAIWKGVMLAPLLIIFSFLIALSINLSFLFWISIYFILTWFYSLHLKRLVLVDCLVLAILYTIRIVAGAAAINVPLSFWLLAFSIFLFLSLSFVKRFSELQSHSGIDAEKIHGRGYYIKDAPLIQQLGITSGYAATLVLALYLNSDNVARLYRTPEIIWGAIPLILLWVSWLWLKAHRGQMHDDPVVFAVKDKVSILIGIFFISIFTLARVW